jgi:hypothetical protein
MGSKSRLASSRALLASRCASAVGALGLLLSLAALYAAPSCSDGSPILCIERAPLVVSAAISCWSGATALRWTRCGLPLRPRGASQWDRTTALLLARSAASGAIVALLGWRALLGQASHLAIVAAMQANSTVGAWLACELQRGPGRTRSPAPAATPASGEREGGGASGALVTPRRGLSLTLPRGWRYHRSTGLFEHKRTGRMQREPPGETGSPLCNLPPCDEERMLLEDGSDAGSDRDSGCEGGRRAWRSRTWHDGHRKESSRSATLRTPMNLWELRAALGGSAGSRVSHSDSRGHGYGDDAV